MLPPCPSVEDVSMVPVTSKLPVDDSEALPLVAPAVEVLLILPLTVMFPLATSETAPDKLLVPDAVAVRELTATEPLPVEPEIRLIAPALPLPRADELTFCRLMFVPAITFTAPALADVPLDVVSKLFGKLKVVPASATKAPAELPLPNELVDGLTCKAIAPDGL